MTSVLAPRPISAILTWPWLGSAARLALAAPFLISGITKLADFAGATAEMAALGLQPAAPVAGAVILAQLAGSALFLTRRFCWVGAGFGQGSRWRPLSSHIRSGPADGRQRHSSSISASLAASPCGPARQRKTRVVMTAPQVTIAPSAPPAGTFAPLRHSLFAVIWSRRCSAIPHLHARRGHACS
jgi:hypothetical protein